MLSVLPITFVELVFGRFKFALVGLCHSTTASHALMQASRSSDVVQPQISVHSSPVGLCVTRSPGWNCVIK